MWMVLGFLSLPWLTGPSVPSSPLRPLLSLSQLPNPYDLDMMMFIYVYPWPLHTVLFGGSICSTLSCQCTWLALIRPFTISFTVNSSRKPSLIPISSHPCACPLPLTHTQVYIASTQLIPPPHTDTGEQKSTHLHLCPLHICPTIHIRLNHMKLPILDFLTF